VWAGVQTEVALHKRFRHARVPPIAWLGGGGGVAAKNLHRRVRSHSIVGSFQGRRGQEDRPLVEMAPNQLHTDR